MQLGGLMENEYATKDLYFAAFLQVKGLQIKKLEKYGRSNTTSVNDNQRVTTPVYFIFNNRTRCEDLESLFWNGVGEELMINGKDFVSAVRDLRARAFSVSRVVSRVEGSSEPVEEEV